MVGRVRQIGQVGQENWYAMCQSPTTKPAWLLAQVTPQTGKKNSLKGGKKKNYLSHVARQRNDMRKTPATQFCQTQYRRQAEKRKTTCRMLRDSATICAQLQRHSFRTAPITVGGCIARQGRRQIKAAARAWTHVLNRADDR